MTRHGDISEEAKQAIANAAMIRARNRLRQDGSSSDDAFRKRVLLLAAERNLPPAEYAKLLHKRVPMKPIKDFCQKHDVSLDWLMDGDLKGLQRMKKWERQGNAMNAMTADERCAVILQKLRALSPENQKIVLEWINLQTEIEPPSN
jgi:hypothetical protein